MRPEVGLVPLFGMRRGITTFLKLLLSLLVNFMLYYLQYIYKTNLKFFGSPAPLGVSFTRNPTLKIHLLSHPFCKWRIEIKEGKDRRLKVILHGVIHKHDFECYKNVPKMFWVVATLSQHCYPKIRRCKSPRVRSPYWSHNQLQKYLRHCTVFWHKWPVHDLVLVIPPPPIIKVASNGRPYSKLRGTTFNGREEGGQYYTSQPCDQERFSARKVVFSWECLNINFLQLVAAINISTYKYLLFKAVFFFLIL